MTAESDEDRIERLTDALVDDVLNRSDEKVLDEAAEAYGERQALATQFDELVNRTLKQGTVKKSDGWMSFDLPSRPLATDPASEAALLDEPAPRAVLPGHPSILAPFRKINTRWGILAALLIIIVGPPSGYYILKRQIQKEANIETAQKVQEIETKTAHKIQEIETKTAQKMQEIEQQKSDIQQQRLALLSMAESRQRAEEDSSKRAVSRAMPVAPPSANDPPSAMAPPSAVAPPSGIARSPVIARPLAAAPPSTVASPSTVATPSSTTSPWTVASPALTIRAPVQPKTGGNFVQIFFLAQHAGDVQNALRRIQSQFPKQVKNTSVFLQADVGAKDQFYGIQIGTFETLERAERACVALRRPEVQCIAQPSGPIAPPIGLDALIKPPSPAATPSPAGAAGPPARVGGERGAK